MAERYPKDHLRPLLLVVDRVGGPPARYPRVELMGRLATGQGSSRRQLADNNQCLRWVAIGLQTLPMVVWIPTVLGYTGFVGQNLTIRSSM